MNDSYFPYVIKFENNNLTFNFYIKEITKHTTISMSKLYKDLI